MRLKLTKNAKKYRSKHAENKPQMSQNRKRKQVKLKPKMSKKWEISLPKLNICFLLMSFTNYDGNQFFGEEAGTYGKPLIIGSTF